MNVAKIQPPEEPQGGGVTPGNSMMQGPQITTVGNTVELYQLELVVSWGSAYLQHHARFVTLRAQESQQNGQGIGLPPRPLGGQAQAMIARRTQAGFTLIEMLLAITLLALLIAGAYGGISTAAKAMHAGERAIDRADRLRTAQVFLRTQLSHIVPLTYERDEEENTVHVFDGGAQFMRFVAPMPGYLSRGGPYVETLELRRGSNGLQLVFTDSMLNGYDAEQSANRRTCRPHRRHSRRTIPIPHTR